MSASLVPLPAAPLPDQQIEIPAGGARDVTWPIAVPVGVARLAWEVSARTGDGKATDRLKVAQLVKPVHPVRTYQATIAQLATPLRFPPNDLRRPRRAAAAWR
jgi:hypothetical protein